MINIIAFNVSLIQGMAGPMRVKRLLYPLYNKGSISLSNLVITLDSEKSQINDSGIVNEMPYLYIGYNSPFNLLEIWAFFRKGFRFINENFQEHSINIMYVYGYPDIKNIFFILYAKKLGYKVIFDIVEDNRFNSKFKSFIGWLRNKSSIFLIRKIPKIADGIVVISTHLKSRMEKLCNHKIPIIHIPIIVDFSRIGANTLGKIKDCYTIFYGGSFAEKDGLSLLVNAFNKLTIKHDNIRLVLTGKPSFSSDFEKLNINSKYIQYKGFLSEDDYYNELNNADIFCMTRINSPYANAGFPFKLGEFLATGKAIVATDVGDVADYIKNDVNGILIKPDSQDEIVKAIEYFLIRPERITEMGNEARKTALNYFDSNKLSDELFTFIGAI